MKNFLIINPQAGHGEAIKTEAKNSEVIKYVTQSVGDAERYVNECCNSTEGELHFTVCGGDGTLNEVVNGIMSAKANDRASFSVLPLGSGNDFVRGFRGKEGEHIIDLIKYNGRYAANMLNMGFDCDVVEKTAMYKNKKLISGSMAYILGIVNVLFHKMGKDFKITVTDAKGDEEVFNKSCLLTAAGNLPFCGGGFKALPLALSNDGLLDVIIISKISRLKFITLVSDYRKGTYINPETGEIIKKFKKVIQYRKGTKIKIENLKTLCADGEIEKADKVEIEILPKAIKYIHKVKND